MKILITGGAGYVGSSMAQRLIEIGHHVIVWDALHHGGEGILPLIGHPRFEFEQIDLTQPLPPCGCDAVVHLAAIVGEAACVEAGRNTSTAINVMATKRVVDHFLDKPLVFFSTCSNYGRFPGEADEKTKLLPTGIYSHTKVKAEKIIRDADKVVLRFATICGPSPRPRFDLMVNDMARRAVLGLDFDVFSPKAWRPFIHIHDVTDAALLGLAFTYTGTYNVVGENWQKVMLVDEAVGRLGLYANISAVGPDVDPRDYRVSGNLFAAHAGFEPKRKIVDAMMQVADQVRILPDSARPNYRNAAA